jgi:hypothetical protein
MRFTASFPAGVGLAFGGLHHFAHEEAEQPFVAGAVGRHLVRVALHGLRAWRLDHIRFVGVLHQVMFHGDLARRPASSSISGKSFCEAMVWLTLPLSISCTNPARRSALIGNSPW